MALGEPLSRDALAAGYRDWVERVSAMHHDFHACENDPVAWAPPRRPLPESRVALLTTAGVALAADPPFDQLSPLGDSSYRAIPSEAPGRSLAISHNHYDHSDADRDVNCIFPIDRLRALAQGGALRLASTHYGFMGFNPNPAGLLASAAAVADRLVADGVDVALLTPG